MENILNIEKGDIFKGIAKLTPLKRSTVAPLSP